MKLTALSIALIAALGMLGGCSTQGTPGQASRQTDRLADAHSQYALGRFYQGQQRYALAIEAYRRALAANPAHAGAHNGLGASLLLAGRNTEAIEQFKAGLRHQPRSAALWNNLGYAYSLGGENRLAEMAYKQSLDLDPTDFKTNANLAMVRQASPKIAPAPVVAAPTVAAPAASTPAAEMPAAAPASTTQASAPQPETAAAPAEAVASAPIIEDATPAPEAATVAAAETPAIAPPPVQAEASSADAAPASPAATDAPVATATADTAPVAKPQPAIETAQAAKAPAPVQVVEIAPRVYELNLPDTRADRAIAQASPVAGAATISVPLRGDVAQTAATGSEDFVLEIRNGNGVRRLAWRTSQYLASHGYTTRRLTNQRGFNVKVTRVFYLPGYEAEAARLLGHLPRDTVLTETTNLRRGIHVRVVLGKDMVPHQAALDAAPRKIRLAALQP